MFLIERESLRRNTMPNRQLIGRRQFLIVSSTCAVAAATVGPKLFASERASQPKRLAVGFATLEEPAVFDAARVPAGDGRFIGRGARIVASGASGASADPRLRRGVELLAHYSYFEGAERLSTPFVAWACSRATGCQGNGVGFTVPVDDVQKIVFTIGVETGRPAGAASRRDTFSLEATESVPLPLTLSLQNEPGSVKLARGYYVVVPMFENDSDPRWSAWQLGTAGGRRALVDGDGNVAPFEHFVLKVDYAS
jgi:hypothetical protein